MKLNRAILITLVVIISAVAFSEVPPGSASKELLKDKLHALDRLATQYQVYKNRVAEEELSQRKVLAKLYEINHKIKKMAEEKKQFSEKVMDIKGRVKDIAHEIAILEDTIDKQRSVLSRRLRAMYMMGAQGVLRVLFSSQNANDFDRNIRFLKIMTQRDYEIISEYKENLKEMKSRKNELSKEIKHLVLSKRERKEKEQELLSKQQEKSNLLSGLERKKLLYLDKIKSIKKHSQSLAGRRLADQLMNLFESSFFERKGSLPYPVDGEKVSGFGLVQNPVYRYRLTNKGLFLRADKGEAVHSIFEGRVTFVGELPGVKNVVIIDHGDHYYTVYGSVSSVNVKAGDWVESEEKIAHAGVSKTYKTSGLYFEVRHFSEAVDPEKWVTRTEPKTDRL